MSPGDWFRSLRVRTGRRSERLFAGHRDSHRMVCVITREGVAPLPHRRFRGDAPFDWGARDAGALELASALLHEARRRRVPDGVVFEFARDFVAGLPRDGFVICADDVRAWLGRRERVSRTTNADPQYWTAAQCWLFPFAWPVGRSHDDAEIRPRDRHAGGR